MNKEHATFIKDYIEQNWERFISYLKSVGIPEDECEDYANEILRDLE